MINIVQVGVGPMGQKVVQYALQRKGINLVAAVDRDPEKTGKDLGILCSLGALGVKVEKTLGKALAGKKADVAVVATVSSLEKVKQQIEEIARANLHIVSTCEELSYPWKTQPEIAQRIDEVCKANGIACVGTGVNPGFLMDYLPSVLSSVCQRVEQVIVTRVQDASKRRIPFQQKIGAGLNDEQFRDKKQNGTLRHVGLQESLHMIARALNWKLDSVEETLKPVLAERAVSSGYTKIARGNSCGVEQIAKGFIGEEEKVILHFRAAVGEEESFDKIEIKGTPTFTSTIAGGVNGDVATSAITVNAIPSILKARPGLKTMLEIPVSSCFAEI